MSYTHEIKFVNGLFVDDLKSNIPRSFSKDSFIIDDWILNSVKKKIICYCKDEECELKCQLFSDGYFKIAIRNNGGKWISTRKGLIRKFKSNFSGIIYLPSGNVIDRKVFFTPIKD